MPEEQRKNKGNWIIGVGTLSVVGALVIISIFTRVFSDTPATVDQAAQDTAATEQVNTVTVDDENTQVLDYVNDDSAEQEYDPLVTVVPQGAVGGTPNPLATDPQRGAVSPTVTLIEFGDFECEACAGMSPIITQLLEEYPNTLSHVWKDYPLPQLHQYAVAAAESARCAQQQDAFWPYHDQLLERQDTFILSPWVDIAADLGLDTDTFTSCIENRETEDLVVQGYFAAKTLELDETPTYYINDQLVTGAQTYEQLKTLIDEEIQEAKNQ